MCFLISVIIPPVAKLGVGGGGVYWNHLVHLSLQVSHHCPLKCMQPNLVWWCIIMTWSVMRKDCCLEGQGHSASSHLCSEDIFWTTKLYATKSGVMVHHQVKVTVQAHTFVRKISSEPLDYMQPNLVWWCIIMTRTAMRKGWVPIFKVKVTERG